MHSTISRAPQIHCVFVTVRSWACRGDWAGAVRMWKRAAKAQQPVAMFKLGHHLYKGDLTTLGRNVEDSVMWLQRFQRFVSDKLVRS